jgi:hypothetical protein
VVDSEDWLESATAESASRTPELESDDADVIDTPDRASRNADAESDDAEAIETLDRASLTEEDAKDDPETIDTDPSHVVGPAAANGSMTTGEHGGCCAQGVAGALGVCARLAGAESCSPQPAIRRCRTPPRTG